MLAPSAESVSVRLDLPRRRYAVADTGGRPGPASRDAPAPFLRPRGCGDHARGEPRGRSPRGRRGLARSRDQPFLSGSPVLLRCGARGGRTVPCRRRRARRAGSPRRIGAGLGLGGPDPRAAGADAVVLSRERRTASRASFGPRLHLSPGGQPRDGGGPPPPPGAVHVRRRAGRPLAGSRDEARGERAGSLRGVQLGASGPAGPPQSEVLGSHTDARPRRLGPRVLGGKPAGERLFAPPIPRGDPGRAAAHRHGSASSMRRRRSARCSSSACERPKAYRRPRWRHSCPREGRRRLAQDCRDWRDAGLLAERDGRVALTERGFLVSNEILCRFV